VGRIHWIASLKMGRLAIMRRPRGGDCLEDEIRDWRAAGIDVVVSLLESLEAQELGLQAEAELCRANGMDFISFPIAAHGVPNSRRDAQQLVNSIAAALAADRAVAIHCQAGIGRSSVIAACALICSGFNPETVFREMSRVRGVSLPETDEQREWVSSFKFASDPL
jgi:protein-tyrosine phosphatase